MTPVSLALAGALADAEFDLKEKLVATRKAAGLSQADVAAALRRKVRDIKAFERLDSNPTLSMIRYYAYAVGALVTFDVTAGWTEQAANDDLN